MSLISRRERRRVPRYDDPNETVYGRIEADPELCTGCTLCAQVCPGAALEIVEDKCRMKAPPLAECAFCGACQAICPADAITLLSAHRYSGRFKTIDQGEPKPPRLSPEW